MILYKQKGVCFPVMTKNELLSSPKLLVFIATLNEEEGIGPTITELKKHLEHCCFLVVDGKSNDLTATIANKMDAEVVTQKGKGKGDAIGFGLRQLKNRNYDYIVLTDADFTYPAEFVPSMIQILEENPQVGMVSGNRFHSFFDWSAIRNPYYFGNRALAFAHNILNGVEMNDPLTGLRLVRWSILKDWKPVSKGFDIEIELNHRVENLGYQIVEIDIPYRKRLGEKKLKLRHGFTILKRILFESL